MFQKGQSGNPNGRPRLPEDVKLWSRKIFDAHGRRALEDEIREQGPYWFKALELLLAYGYGRPTQPIEQNGTVTVEHVDHRTVDEALDYAAQRRRLRAVS